MWEDKRQRQSNVNDCDAVRSPKRDVHSPWRAAHPPQPCALTTSLSPSRSERLSPDAGNYLTASLSEPLTECLSAIVDMLS